MMGKLRGLSKPQQFWGTKATNVQVLKFLMVLLNPKIKPRKSILHRYPVKLKKYQGSRQFEAVALGKTNSSSCHLLSTGLERPFIQTTSLPLPPNLVAADITYSLKEQTLQLRGPSE